MPELPGTDLLRDWQKMMQSVLERERELQRDLLGRAFEPFDAPSAFWSRAGRRCASRRSAIEHAAKSLEQAAALMKTQADLFERTIRIMREPSRRIESAMGVDPQRPRR